MERLRWWWWEKRMGFAFTLICRGAEELQRLGAGCRYARVSDRYHLAENEGWRR